MENNDNRPNRVTVTVPNVYDPSLVLVIAVADSRI